MLKMVERNIALQLLVFYGLFVIPLLAGGAELYFFQHDALQQSAQQADLGVAQAIAEDAQTFVQGGIAQALDLARGQATLQLERAQLAALFDNTRQTHPQMSQVLFCDPAGKILLSSPAALSGTDQAPGLRATWQAFQSSPAAFLLDGVAEQRTGKYTLLIMARVTDSANRLAGGIVLFLSLQQLDTQLRAVQHPLNDNGETRIWLIDSHGVPIANTQGVPASTNLLRRVPGLGGALQGKAGNSIVSDQQRDWLYSYVPVSGTGWAVAVGRPVDATFATAISFQHSLIIALVMLLVGASVFWFVMHGWMVAPLSRLAQAATMIKPDQAVKVTDQRLLAREKSRHDEIGRLVNAFSTMEEEIHALFRKSDEQSYTRLQTLDALLRSMNEGVLLEDPDGEVVYANQRFTQFVGMLAPEIGRDAFQSKQLTERLELLLARPEVYHEALRRAENGDGPQVIEFQVRGYYNQLGQLVPARRDIRMRLFQVRDMEGQVIGRGKIMLDVTQQNEAEQVKKNLLAIVSHELRTPLTAIKGYATSLLETDIELDAATQRAFLRRIVEEEDRMAELVTSLLEMSQLEAGTLKLAPSLCRLDSLIEQSIASVKNSQAEILVSLPADVPVIYLDRRRMEMVLRNLLENAQRYAGEQARVELTARYALGSEESGVYLSLADNGPGFPEELTERIFERFYQVDGGRERKSSGVGLGLAICRGFVEAHGGRIWAENRGGGATGAIFHIWLPDRLLHTSGALSHHFQLEKIL